MLLLNSPRHQRGVALILSLILLTAVTFLAILGLEGSSLNLKKVSNTQKSEEAFQCAFSELEIHFAETTQNSSDVLDTLNEARFNTTVAGDGTLSWASVQGTSVAPCPGSTTFEVVYTGDININNTLNNDTSAGTFEYLRFDLIATSSIAGIFGSSQVLGIDRIAPKVQ
ncbi:MAG: pilus assembly PilX N-terminal domain-containing protein [Oleibacter sp.]|nr:pilus assembly PilX N-terminal domain-containing protein [Thalassolituus sp.]